MQESTTRLVTNAEGTYAQHELSPKESVFRNVVGTLGVLAIVAALFAMCGYSAGLIIAILMTPIAQLIGFVPDWLGYFAVVLWSVLTLGGTIALLWRGFGAECFKLIDWANGRERVASP
ncbi:MAG: hypothetical protein V4611_03455 [Patescibacteria group bacterium]